MRRGDDGAPAKTGAPEDEQPEPGVGIDALADRARSVPGTARLRVGLGAAVVLLLIGLAVAVAVAVLSPRADSTTVPPVSVRVKDGGAATSPPAATPAALYVHVLGAVRQPGLYRLASGSRVVDAIAAAGGFAKNAEQGGVNLARIVSDGEQLAVPVAGQALPALPGAPTPPGSGTGGTASGAKINLNTATQTELESLPRVGPALARRIIDWRTQNGRFASVQDLANVSGIGEKTFAQLKGLVTV